MKVLILSPYADLIEDTVRKAGDTPIIRSETMEVSDWPEADWVISFGYRKIIQKHTIQKLRWRLINIHLSLLPWNRGADPNFWSWFDGTPKGVTIHIVDEGIDRGAILAQTELRQGVLSDFRHHNPTLGTTYNDLLVAAAGLFNRSWAGIVNDPVASMDHKTTGSYHKVGDMDKFMRLMPLGWSTPVAEVAQLGWLYRGKK